MASGRAGEFKRNRRGDRREHHSQQAKEKPVVDESSPVIQQFLQFQTLLDLKHDKHERIVKLSRDITIESKRTIFLLQRISSDADKEKVFPDAEKKFVEIQSTRWKQVAKELHTEDPYQFLRAYSPGLQEYIEAVSFYHYLKHGDLISLEQVQEALVFQEDIPSKAQDDTDTETMGEKEAVPAASEEENIPTKDSSAVMEPDSRQETFTVHIPPVEYMLGIADLTGELMRMAIHSVGGWSMEQPLQMCHFLRVVHKAFMSFGNTHRELPRKLFTLKQSLQKVEAACYTLQIRGSEIPKHMLAEVLKSVGSDRGAFVDDHSMTDDG